MGNLETLHDILLTGSDFDSCRQQAIRFFDRTMLIRYDEVIVMKEDSLNANHKKFWSRIEEGLSANKKTLGELLASLQEEGFVSIADLQGMEKGYLSKLLHTIAHLQDGFIGIDSHFYNLAEDSHGVSRNLRQKIAAAPETYWLIRVIGKIASASEDSLDALRTFEGRVKHSD